MKFNGTPMYPFVGRKSYLDRPDGIPCDGCDKSCKGHDYYMVKDSVWIVEAALAPVECMMCVACLETRLCRELWYEDVLPVPASGPLMLWLFERNVQRFCGYSAERTAVLTRPRVAKYLLIKDEHEEATT